MIRFFLVLFLCSCATSALQKTTNTIGAARIVQTSAVESVKASLLADLNKHCKDVETLGECTKERAKNFEKAEQILNLSADAIDTLVFFASAWASQVSENKADANSATLNVCSALSKLRKLFDSVLELSSYKLEIDFLICESEKNND